VVSPDNNLWLVAEALDSIMDVFSEDHVNGFLTELNMIPILEMLVPQLKRMVSCRITIPLKGPGYSV